MEKLDLESEPVNISALNQYSYCPRRCALIYLESQFTDNIHTMRGNAEHARVDRVAHVTSTDGARIEYALPVWSDKLGLIGKCDVVEFWPDGAIYPVEYKHGPNKRRENDDLHLAAQTLCLEEMFDRPIAKGAIFHSASRRRREISVDQRLRDQVEDTVKQIRIMLASAVLPPPVNDHRCGECSMNQTCQPKVLADSSRLNALRASLFEPED